MMDNFIATNEMKQWIAAVFMLAMGYGKSLILRSCSF
jgi:hypothetical protein